MKQKHWENMFKKRCNNVKMKISSIKNDPIHLKIVKAVFVYIAVVVVVATSVVTAKTTTTTTTAADTDLYKILGVQRSASSKEIKSAYRRKALDTHPDKNLDKQPNIAAEEFRQVVSAFEILSDKSSRQYYDRTGQQTNTNNNNNNQQQQQRNNNNNFHQFNYQWNNYYHRQQQRLKDRFDVQQAISRVIHIVSIEQLHTIMLDDNDVLERNLLLCFTTAQIDQYVDDELVYPYPFASMSSQGIWWEDLLQTVKIRFYVSNELTKLFGVTAHEIDSIKEPVFMFGKRGTSFDDIDYKFTRLQTKSRTVFEKWMWKQIEVIVQFNNQHIHPIEIYWVHDTIAKIQLICQPNSICNINTMLSHEFYIRDVTIDTHTGTPGRYKLSKQSSLGSYKIINDTQYQIITINTIHCLDKSGHCPFYKMQNDCINNPGFMNHYCQLTCGICTEDTTTDSNNNNEQQQESEQSNRTNKHENTSEL